VELNDLYSSPNIIRVIKSRRRRWAGHVAHRGDRRNACRVLVRKPEEMRPLGRLRPRLGFRERVRALVKRFFAHCSKDGQVKYLCSKSE
jgi:hypothetical protein